MTEQQTQNTPKFIFGESTTSDAPQTVTGIAPVDAYIVTYRDHEGKNQWRLAFHAPNEDPEKDSAMILLPTVRGQDIIKSTSDWFRSQFSKRVRGFLNRDAENQEDTGVAQV